MKKIKDPVSSITHFIGAFLSVPCMIVLIVLAALNDSARYVVSFAIFGASLILLYTASGVYHMLPLSEKAQELLRRIDHMMIFVLIAGTYTPICLITLRGAWGYTLLAVVWTVAFLGIIQKAVWMNAPRLLSTAAYVLMGHIALIAIYPLITRMPAPAFVLLLTGGAVYTTGAVIYALKRPRINSKYFGFHELFHLFVLGGSACHIVMMFFL